MAQVAWDEGLKVIEGIYAAITTGTNGGGWAKRPMGRHVYRGSGKELEVATENIIDQLQKTDSGLWLPLRGRTIEYVRELRHANAQWTLNIISINMDIAISFFVQIHLISDIL